MRHITQEYIQQHPECLKIKDAMDLMLYLAEDETITTLKDLFTYTNKVEQEYKILINYQNSNLHHKLGNSTYF